MSFRFSVPIALAASVALSAESAFGQPPAPRPMPVPQPAPHPIPAPQPMQPIQPQATVQAQPAAQAPAVTVVSEDGWRSASGAPVVMQAAPEAEPNPYQGDLSERLRLTGDWGGARTNLKERGVTVDLYWTQFYQSVIAGGRDNGWEYANKFDGLLNLDTCKMGLWRGGYFYLHGESKFGDSINNKDGLFIPSVEPLLFPKANEDETALTAFKYTQALSENFVVFGGKINTLDDYTLKYSPGMGTNLPGLGGFMNTSLVFNPILLRTVSYSTTGFGAAFLQDGKPFFSVTLLDPEDRTTTGFEDSYSRGVVIMTDAQIRTCMSGRPGLIDVGFVYSTADYRAIDPASYLSTIPLRQISDAGVAAPVEDGSWAAYFNHYQALWVDSCNKDRTWGVFGQYGISDGNPNPIRWTANFGLGGRSPLRCRTYDTFGLGFFYANLSDEFKNLAAPVLPQRNGCGLEAFYNYAITPWARLTGDLQYARPSTVGLDNTVSTGMRFQILF